MISKNMPKMIKDREKLRWVFQRLSGLQLLIFFGIHIWVFFFKLERPVSLESLQEIFLHVEWIIFYTLFISLMVYHAFSGLWTVLTDKNPSKTYKKNWRIVLWVIGGFLILISAWNLILLGRA